MTFGSFFRHISSIVGTGVDPVKRVFPRSKVAPGKYNSVIPRIFFFGQGVLKDFFGLAKFVERHSSLLDI